MPGRHRTPVRRIAQHLMQNDPGGSGPPGKIIFYIGGSIMLGKDIPQRHMAKTGLGGEMKGYRLGGIFLSYVPEFFGHMIESFLPCCGMEWIGEPFPQERPEDSFFMIEMLQGIKPARAEGSFIELIFLIAINAYCSPILYKDLESAARPAGRTGGPDHTIIGLDGKLFLLGSHRDISRLIWDYDARRIILVTFEEVNRKPMDLSKCGMSKGVMINIQLPPLSLLLWPTFGQ
jgi:hypothetical protein